MKRLLFAICCLLITLSSLAQRGQFFSSQNFSSSLISDLCQDSQGFVWIATDYGLNRFDGYHFQTFLHDDADSTSLLANVVVTMLCDREGRLWIGTNRGLDLYDVDRGGHFRHFPFPDGVLPRVSSLLQRKDGTLLVGTAGYGLYSLASPDAQLQTVLPDVEDKYFSRLFEDTEGRLWKSGFDDHIFMFHNGKTSQFKSERGIPMSIFEYDGEVIALCLHGLLVFRNGRFVDADIDMSAVAGKDVIFTHIARNSDGIIYIGTRGNGLYRLSGHRLQRVEASAQGIDQATVRVSAMMFDRRGNLWLGCYRKGLLLLPQQPMQFGNWSFESQGISLGSTISSVCEGDAGRVWCTVQGVGVYGFDAQGRVVARPQAPDAVECIYRDRQQRYWVGTASGLYAYDPLTGRSQLKVTYDCDKFHDVTSDDEGRLYISTFARGFCVYDPETGSLKNHNFYEENDSLKGRLCNNWVLGLAADDQGLIWMATSSGVSCYDPTNDSFRSQGWNQLLDGVVCFDVCELHVGQLADGRQLDGCIAIGTEQGLYLYDRKTRQVERFPG
ncbi:MAG: hypothetical protein K2I98_02125, partial [Prevotella sp.]|nr:hypothetical protein [Prevotella sp.]